MTQKIALFLTLVLMSAHAFSAQTPSKDECASAMRKTIACMVGQEPLEECHGCKSVAQIFKECVNRTTFESKAQLKIAAKDKSEERKDPSLISLAIMAPKDSLVMRKCFLRCTQRLVKAQECELAQGKDCQNVDTAAQVLQECRAYFNGGKTGFYNEAMQYRMAKEYASNSENVPLVIALQQKEHDATFIADCKAFSIPILIFTFFAAAPYVLGNNNDRGF